VHEIEAAYVGPFYLKMMGLNALRHADGLWLQLIEAGRAVTDDEVRWMLAGTVTVERLREKMPATRHWRPMVMGGWLALARPAGAVRDDLLAAMEHSGGSLTAPSLCVSAHLLAGAAAVPAMRAYPGRDQTRHDGSERFVGAALESLGAPAPVVPDDQDRENFTSLLGLAGRLRDAFIAR